MGLDMYLTKHYYIGGKHAENAEDVVEFSTVRHNGEKEWQFRLGDIESIVLNAMQWRKAYSIDKWFMKKHNYEETYFYVNHEDILELYDIVSEIRKDHSKAEELLPIGDTPRDWYWDDIELTYKGLKSLVDEIKNTDANFSLYYEHSA